MASDRMREVVRAGIRRRNPSPEHTEAIKEYQNAQSDWKGVCQYCKRTLSGTVADLLAHSCKEFEEKSAKAS